MFRSFSHPLVKQTWHFQGISYPHLFLVVIISAFLFCDFAFAAKLYWTDSDGSSNGRVRRADLDGTDKEDLVLSIFGAPEDIVIDASGGRMYWAVFKSSAHKIQRAELDGQNSDNLVDLSGLGFPFGIDIDLNNSPNQVYWTCCAGVSQPPGSITKADLGMTPPSCGS